MGESLRSLGMPASFSFLNPLAKQRIEEGGRGGKPSFSSGFTFLHAYRRFLHASKCMERCGSVVSCERLGEPSIVELMGDGIGLESVEKRLDLGDAGLGWLDGERRSVVVFQVDNEHGGLRCCNRIDEENDGVTKKKRALHREDSLVVVSQREMGV